MDGFKRKLSKYKFPKFTNLYMIKELTEIDASVKLASRLYENLIIKEYELYEKSMKVVTEYHRELVTLELAQFELVWLKNKSN